MVEASRGLADIPGVLAVEVGTVVPGGRAMHAYLRHPDHVETVREVIAPLAGRITVYDFRE